MAIVVAQLLPVAAQEPAPLTVSLQTQTVGNTAFAYLTVSGTSDSGISTRAVPPWRIPGCSYWSQWTLIRSNPISQERTYGVYIYDGCNNDAQVYPVPTDVRQGSCNNDDNLFPTGKFSVCPIIDAGHVPAGLPFDARCEALTEADTSLFADLSPPTYDATQPTTLTLTASFADDMTQRLSEGTCTDVLGWNVVAWKITWPDGSVEHLPGTQQQGITRTHALAAQPQAPAGTQQSDATVVAHLHIVGQALDFDRSGNLVVRHVDGYVDISNHDSASGSGAAPVDVPPQLQVGALAEGEAGDGSLPPPDTTQQASAHAVTIRGRLLALHLSPIVLRPGTEMVDGVEVGVATSRVLRWRYLGPATDAPPREGTSPGAGGDAATPIVVQYDHPERLDGLGRPVDETVPVEMVVRTVYPDGQTLDTTLDGDIAVSIYYAGLSSTG